MCTLAAHRPGDLPAGWTQGHKHPRGLGTLSFATGGDPCAFSRTTTEICSPGQAGQRQARSRLEGRWGEEGSGMWEPQLVPGCLLATTSPLGARFGPGDVGMRMVLGFRTAMVALVICVGLVGRGLARWPLENTERPAYGPRFPCATGTQIGHLVHPTHRLSIY